jgi:Flp pilus assembly protein TadG
MTWRRIWKSAGRPLDSVGTVSIELALIGPVLVLMLVGVIEWGRYMYTYNTLQFGCEQAVRWGAFHITGTTDAIEDYAKNQMVGVTPDEVAVVINADTNTVEVSANVQFVFLTSLVSPFPSIEIRARAKM